MRSIPNAKGLSRLGPRGTFGLALGALANENDRVVGLTADLSITAGMERFRAAHPDRFYNVGIAEQNLVCIASGLADDGWIPFATTFANFAALRACEFVRHHMGYMQQNIKLVGIGAGFAMGQFGTTHYSLEDVAALRSIPNLTIISPADCSEVVEAVQAAAEIQGPVYLRLNGTPSMPIVDQPDSDFKIGQAREISVGSDITFLCTGSMVSRCVKASEALRDSGLSVGVLNLHTIKPIDRHAVLKVAASTSTIVSVEEHSVIGGLGSAIAETLMPLGASVPHLALGVADHFPTVGSYEYVLAECGLAVDGIANSAGNFLKLQTARA